MKLILVNICIIFTLLFVSVHCDAPLTRLEFQPTFTGLDLFVLPVDLDSQGNNLYVTSLFGQVFSFANNPSVSSSNVFFDLASSGIQFYVGFDEGLLSFQFHPLYPAVPKVYACFTPTDQSLAVAAFTVSNGAVNYSSMDVLFNITRPLAKQLEGFTEGYLGGDLQFTKGSGNNYDLYISIGFCNEDNVSKDSLLGKVLRVTPSTTGSGYSIPSSNPGSNSPIFASGHRNPRKLFFSPNNLFVGDVGDVWDEINVIQKNKNYGWDAVEGCSNDFKFANPVYTYTSELDHALTLGPYYPKDGAFESLQNRMLFADLYSGQFYSLQTSGLGQPCGRIVPDTVATVGAFISSILVVDDDVFVANVLSLYGAPLFYKLVSVPVY